MNFFKKLSALFATFFGLVGLAHAELPTAVTTAIADAQTDVSSAGALILAIVTVIAGIFWVRRVIR